MNYDELGTNITKVNTAVEKVYNYLYNTVQPYNYKTNTLLGFLSAKKTKYTEYIDLKPASAEASIYGSSVRRSFVCSLDGTMQFMNPSQYSSQTALLNVYPNSNGDRLSIFKTADNKTLNKNMTIISRVTIEKSDTFVQRQIVDVPLEFNYYSGGIEIELDDNVRMDFISSENVSYSKAFNKLYITKDTLGDSLENIVLGLDSSKANSVWAGKFNDTVVIKIEYYRIFD